MLLSLCRRLLLPIALAAAAASSSAQTTDILTVLKESRPDLEFGKLQSSVIEGYGETQTGGVTLYVADKGDHFFVGELVRLVDNEIVSETERSMARARLEVLAEASANEMIIFPAVGEKRGTIDVFTDETCPYCKHLHGEVAELNEAGVEVRYLAWPRTGLGTLEALKNTTAWCSQDRPATLAAIKEDRFEGEDISCADNPVAKHYGLGIRLGVTGTPAVILEDGTLVPGYRPAAEFLQMLGLAP